MDANLVAIIIAILAGIFGVGWIALRILKDALEADKDAPPMISLRRLKKALPSTVKDVVCPHCQHRFDVQIVIE